MDLGSPKAIPPEDQWFHDLNIFKHKLTPEEKKAQDDVIHNHEVTAQMIHKKLEEVEDVHEDLDELRKAMEHKH